MLTQLDFRAIIGSRSELDLRYYELDYELDVRVLFVLTTRSAGAIIGTGTQLDLQLDFCSRFPLTIL